MNPRFKRLAASRKDAVSKSLSSISNFCHKNTRHFYWSLAFFLSVVIALLGFFRADVAAINGATFDTVMKMRWTSPSPSKEIVILDIDEKSLAEMAPDYGRWPWRRDVFAQVLAELEFAEAKSIMFTVLITDPDTDHPRSDATLSFVASESYVTVYPLVRLPAGNDVSSKLEVCDLIPAGAMRCRAGQVLAAILPALPGMQHDLGIMNHRLDDDGILRRWSLLWNDGSWKMPTMVGGALALAHIDPKVAGNISYILNWRNRRNSYKTISISDYIATLDGDGRIPGEFFKDKHVIIAASALGLTVRKPTSVGLMHDGEILATALDDAINGTYLRPTPIWVVLVLTIVFIWGLAALFVFGRSQRRLDGMFAGIQVGAVGVMALAINYTTYFIDLTPLATFGLVYYMVGRVHHMLASRVFMGAPGHLERIIHNSDQGIDFIGVIAFNDEMRKFQAGKWNMVRLQKEFDTAQIFFCHNSFEKNQIFEGANDVVSIIVIGSAGLQDQLLKKVTDYLGQRGIDSYISQVFEIPDVINSNRALIPRFIASKTLGVVAQVPVA